MSYQHQIIGTVISSVLNYDQLCKEMGENPAIDNTKSSYAPCDGRSILGSKLEINTQSGIKTSPDLRGKFVRGLNVIYSAGQPLPFNPMVSGDPQNNRTVGDFQADDFHSHAHPENAPHVGGVGTWSFPDAQAWSSVGQRPFGAATDPVGGDETRPRNISVYFYIKIN